MIKRIWKLLLEALRGEETLYTSGGINRAIFLLSIPMILEMLMEALFAIVDVFFVSRISVDAVATVGLTESVMTLIYSIAIGLSTAATAMVSRRVGEGQPEEAGKAAMQVIWLGAGISLVLAIAGGWFSADILRLMGGSPELVASGQGYTRVMFYGNATIMLLFLLNGIFRGAGNATLAMYSLWISNGLNIILDPCLIFGLGPFPEMGVQGAAVATNIGRGAGVVFQLVLLLRGSGVIKLVKKHLRVYSDIMLRLLSIASGGTFQYLIASASWIVLMRIIAPFGSDVLAGYTIAIRILIFSILPAWGMANAAATLVRQNLGAGQPDRAESSAWRTAFYNMLFLLSVSVVSIIFAPQMIRFFHEGPEVVHAGVQALRIICTGYLFFAYGMVLGQAFNGAGDTFTPTLANFICFWMIEIPLAYTLATYLGVGPPGVYIAVAVSESLLALLLMALFRRGKWKTTEV